MKKREGSGALSGPFRGIRQGQESREHYKSATVISLGAPWLSDGEISAAESSRAATEDRDSEIATQKYLPKCVCVCVCV